MFKVSFAFCEHTLKVELLSLFRLLSVVKFENTNGKAVSF